MKKTLAIILSVLMIFGLMPMAMAADEAVYDRYAVSSGDEDYIADMTSEQIATVILDWVDREIAKYSADIEDAILEGVITEGGFDQFEEFLGEEGVENLVAENMPEITSLDAVISYKSYLTELGGDFATLDATNLITRTEAGSSIGFINGVIQFMADNSEAFGKVFRWDDEVFDYGKVGEYIKTFENSEDEDEKAIYKFYTDYLVGNDIQSKFTNWVATQMGYEIPEGETFDDTLNNGIMAWFSGLCETNGILSADGLAELRAYDLRTTDIYTLVKNFVALVQSDNQEKIDTYYNYIMDTVVRTLLKTTLGQTATVGAEATLPESFTATYADLALLEEISGGTAYYKDGDTYYQVTIADGAVTACNTITWADSLEINFEAPKVEILTGENAGSVVAEYRPTDEDYKQLIYSTYSEQIAAEGFTVAGTTVADEYAALMVDANKGPEMSECFGVKVTQGENVISDVVIGFDEIEEYVNGIAVTKANEAAAKMVDGSTITAASVKSVDVTMAYDAWATADEFIVKVSATAKATASVTAMGFTVEQELDATSYITNPVAVIVLDDLSGNINIDDAKALLDFIDTDFDIDDELLDLEADLTNGKYDTYNGAVGQVNHILYGLVDMLVSEDGMNTLALTDGDNTNLYENLEKICATANDMMTAAEEVMNDEGLQEMLAGVGIDLSAMLGELDLDLLYAIDFSSVEALWTSVIGLGLDMVDDGSNQTLTEIHTAVDGLTNLDAMAVAMADYLLGKCIPELNSALGCTLTAPAKTNAAAVTDGAGKDIIMTKLVDVIYDVAEWGVGFANDKVNELIGHIEGETETDLPTVAFELGVTEGENWEETLTALVDRVYELADGIIIACDNDYTDTFDRIAAVANAILPLGSLASNCASDDGKLALDVNKVVGYIFDDGLNGDIDGFLGLFETKTKTADVAADCSVTEALINASQHIVDSIFPGTVVASDYVGATSEKFTQTTVQEYFTSAENDAVIASNNMDSINDRKADLVPAALNLVREAGILPFFAACEHTGETIPVPSVEATCTSEGSTEGTKCADCGYIISGCETVAKKTHSHTPSVTTAPTCTTAGVRTYKCTCGDTYTEAIPATGHSFGAWSVYAAAGCESTGIERRTCPSCNAIEERTIAATGHTDANGDDTCDGCGISLKEEDTSFFGKIKAFFQRIIEWFKNLFR